MKNTNKNIAAAIIISVLFFVPVFCSAQTDEKSDQEQGYVEYIDMSYYYYLRDILDDLDRDLDGMNEIDEMTSLRLQMTMDRRSKFISTLSQMMKKISTTQDILIQNVK